MKKKINPFVAGLLSIIIPGLGQIYSGKRTKGVIILAVVIIIANLNIFILPLIALANPQMPPLSSDLNASWRYWIPRIIHDVVSFWSIVLWIYIIIDAYKIANDAKSST